MDHSPRLGDTICVNSTTLPSPIAVIRISGDDAIRVTRLVFNFKDDLTERKIYTKKLHLNSFKDDVMVWVAPNPNTVTGENYAEVFVHGSSEIVRQVLGKFLDQGVRMAHPGEFTYRGYIHGKKTLMEAMALPGLLGSQTPHDLDLVSEVLNGKIDEQVMQVKEKTIKLYNALQVLLDYGGQGYGSEELETSIGIHSASLLTELQNMKRVIGPLLDQSIVPKAIILGAPNVGKSTLFNRLIGYERAITHDQPGTTRDYITAPLGLSENTTIEVVDTAGIRETNDWIEAAGIQKAQGVAQNANIIILLISLENFSNMNKYNILNNIREESILWLVGTKQDKASPLDMDSFKTWLGDFPEQRRPNVVTLLNLLDKENQSLAKGLATLNTHVAPPLSRHCVVSDGAKMYLREILSRGDECIRHFQNDSYDLGHVCLEQLIPVLSIMTGEVSEDDIYEKLFSSFCLGK
jgi:tRNA modification GTPase